MDKCIYIGLRDGNISAVCANIAPSKEELAAYLFRLAVSGGFNQLYDDASPLLSAIAEALLPKAQNALREHKKLLRASLPDFDS